MSSLSWVGKTIGGRYQIEALLGQGGMSAVYRAFDPNLRRTVAIKLIHPHLSTDPNFVGRFKEEAAAIARLRHPNIVQVHDFDMDGETYYMVMEYLIGETLQARLKRLNLNGRYLSYSDSIRICTQICDAAGYAHDHELIHRDIKPANIMLDVQDHAILMDFGIVKIIGGEYHTSTGATIGTAMYMSPEQIRGERIDDRSDIYSLGVTLYEMVSGRPPYQADSAVTLMMMVLNDPLPNLRTFRKDLSDELESVICIALAKDKKNRYQSMAEMASALQLVQGKLMTVPPEVTVVELNKTESIELGSSPVSGSITEGGTLPDSAKGESLPGVDHEMISSDLPLQKPVGVVPPGSLEQSERREPVPTSSAHPVSAARIGERVGLRRLIVPILGIVLLLAAMIGGYLYFSAKQPPKLQLAPITYSAIPIDTSTARSVISLATWSTDSYVYDLAFSPDGTLLATANNRDWVRLSQYRFYSGLWQVEPGNLLRYLTGHDQWVSAVAFSPDGQLLATASEDASVSLWQVPGGSLVQKIETTFGGIRSVNFSSSNMLLAAGSWDGYIGLWRVSDGNLLRTLPKQEYGISDVKFSPDGSILVASSDVGSILVWAVSDGSLLQTLQSHSEAINRIAFSTDGTLLASASEDHSVKLWRLKDYKLIHTLEGHTETVKDVAFSMDGSLLASGADDGTLRLWQVKDGQLMNTFDVGEGMLSVAFSPNGYYLVSGGAYGIIHFWGLSEAIPLEITPTPVLPR